MMTDSDENVEHSTPTELIQTINDVEEQASSTSTASQNFDVDADDVDSQFVVVLPSTAVPYSVSGQQMKDRLMPPIIVISPSDDVSSDVTAEVEYDGGRRRIAAENSDEDEVDSHDITKTGNSGSTVECLTKFVKRLSLSLSEVMKQQQEDDVGQSQRGGADSELVSRGPIGGSPTMWIAAGEPVLSGTTPEAGTSVCGKRKTPGLQTGNGQNNVIYGQEPQHLNPDIFLPLTGSSTSAQDWTPDLHQAAKFRRSRSDPQENVDVDSVGDSSPTANFNFRSSPFSDAFPRDPLSVEGLDGNRNPVDVDAGPGLFSDVDLDLFAGVNLEVLIQDSLDVVESGFELLQQQQQHQFLAPDFSSIPFYAPPTSNRQQQQQQRQQTLIPLDDYLRDVTGDDAFADIALFDPDFDKVILPTTSAPHHIPTTVSHATPAVFQSPAISSSSISGPPSTTYRQSSLPDRSTFQHHQYHLPASPDPSCPLLIAPAAAMAAVRSPGHLTDAHSGSLVSTLADFSRLQSPDGRVLHSPDSGVGDLMYAASSPLGSGHRLGTAARTFQDANAIASLSNYSFFANSPAAEAGTKANAATWNTSLAPGNAFQFQVAPRDPPQPQQGIDFRSRDYYGYSGCDVTHPPEMKITGATAASTSFVQQLPSQARIKLEPGSPNNVFASPAAAAVIMDRNQLHGCVPASPCNKLDSVAEERRKLAKASSFIARFTREQLMLTDERGDTMLHNMVRKGAAHYAEALVHRLDREQLTGSIINQRSRQSSETPLSLAVMTNQPHVVQLLVERKANVNAKVFEGSVTSQRNLAGRGDLGEFCSPLHYVAAGGSKFLPTLKELLAAPSIDLRIVDSQGRSPLHRAVEVHGQLSSTCSDGAQSVLGGGGRGRIDSTEIIQQLVEHGADINQRDLIHHKTAMVWAVERVPSVGDVDLVRLLLQLQSGGASTPSRGRSASTSAAGTTGTGSGIATNDSWTAADRQDVLLQTALGLPGMDAAMRRKLVALLLQGRTTRQEALLGAGRAGEGGGGVGRVAAAGGGNVSPAGNMQWQQNWNAQEVSTTRHASFASMENHVRLPGNSRNITPTEICGQFYS